MTTSCHNKVNISLRVSAKRENVGTAKMGKKKQQQESLSAFHEGRLSEIILPSQRHCYPSFGGQCLPNKGKPNKKNPADSVGEATMRKRDRINRISFHLIIRNKVSSRQSLHLLSNASARPVGRCSALTLEEANSCLWFLMHDALAFKIAGLYYDAVCRLNPLMGNTVIPGVTS